MKTIPQADEIRSWPSCLDPWGVKRKAQIDELGLGLALAGGMDAAFGQLEVFAVAGGNNKQIRGIERKAIRGARTILQSSARLHKNARESGLVTGR